MHHSKDGRRPEAESLIKKHHDAQKLEKRRVEKAEVASAFHGRDGHQKEHVTVEFKDANGNHVTTHHVRGPRDNK
ncbi:hypothetical protein INS49_010081 [Diaporthe citri]|uniref:uncharacterized protein n=1 Tax=Diaporthe citri TaxID=83186 RepID=UPI001C7F95F1|nr:uncharacterized protein INS49_010081 [Diaporthe citri]KAG6361852.1 hypothetical protein INS49_010081 [Diaporthe citri]